MASTSTAMAIHPDRQSLPCIAAWASMGIVARLMLDMTLMYDIAAARDRTNHFATTAVVPISKGLAKGHPGDAEEGVEPEQGFGH